MVGVTVEDADACITPTYQYGVLRPRGTLARALYNKYLSDEHLETLDKHEWYCVDLDKIEQDVSRLHIPLCPDEETNQFLEDSRRLSNSVLTQIYHSLVKFILGFFMTQTSINGWLGRGSMFVFSSEQFSKITGRKQGDDGELADLGAGDGRTTKSMAPFFSKITVTEISGTMRNILRKDGFRIAEIDSWFEKKYDIVSCLNLLDRCERPKTLLGQVRAAMKPNSLAIIATVLPFKPYVEMGTKDNKPLEELQIKGHSFEEQVQSLINDVFIPSGFKVQSWTRLPYLCQGDLNQAYYWLNDALFVLRLPKSD